MGLDASIVPRLKREGEGKAEALFFDTEVQGATLAEWPATGAGRGAGKAAHPQGDELPVAADGWSTVNFVRPAHALVALHGADVIPVSVLGLAAGRETHGHRFEAVTASITIRDADSYAAQMENEGAVIASFEARRADIARQLQEAAAKIGGVKPVRGRCPAGRGHRRWWSAPTCWSATSKKASWKCRRNA